MAASAAGDRARSRRAARGTFVDRSRCLARRDDPVAGALVDVVAGDVVLFDGVAQLEAGGVPWTVGLAVGGFRADVRIDPDGRATIVRGWRFDKRRT